MGHRGRPPKERLPVTPEERARRLRSVRLMLDAGCYLPQVMERFGVSEEVARTMVREARAATKQPAE